MWSECCLDLNNRVIASRVRGKHCHEGDTAEVKSCLVEPLSGLREELTKDYTACKLDDTTPVVFKMNDFVKL